MAKDDREYELVCFRCELELRQKLEELVELSGLSQSELLRRLVMDASVQVPKFKVNLEKVLSRQREGRARPRKKAIAATAAANGVQMSAAESVRA